MSSGDSVVVSTTLSFKDLYRFQVGQMMARLWFVLAIPVVLTAAVLVLLIASKFQPDSANHAGQLNDLVLNLLPLLALFGFLFLVAPAISALSASKNPNLRGGTRYEVSSLGVVNEGQHSRGDIRWAAFIKAKELGWAFLLYPQKNIAYLIPKRDLQSEADLLLLRRLIAENIPKAKMRRH
jgi:hypothetical protein